MKLQPFVNAEQVLNARIGTKAPHFVPNKQKKKGGDYYFVEIECIAVPTCDGCLTPKKTKQLVK